MKKIKWILYHQPVDIFIRTAQHFEEEVNRLSGNKFEFEILELKDYENKYKKGQPCDLMTELKNGNIQMSQVYVFGLAMANASDFLALNPSKAVQQIRQDMADSIKALRQTNDPKQLELLSTQLGRIQRLGGFEAIVPIEGLVFVYGGNTYKLTGAFAPINQLVGILKYNR